MRAVGSQVGVGLGHPADFLSPSLSCAGIPEDSKVEGPAFTDAIRMYRQSKELYGTWEMLCGNEVQVRPGGPVGKLEVTPGSSGWGWTDGLWGTASVDGDDDLRFQQVEAKPRLGARVSL